MAPHQFRGERTLMRIFIGESDRCAAGPYQGEPLHSALVKLFREGGCAGATVLRGLTGFGASAKVHTARLLDLSLDLPVVVEMVETEAKIGELLPELDAMIGGGLVTLEPVRVILYRPGDVPETERSLHAIEGLHPASGGDEEGGGPLREITASIEQYDRRYGPPAGRRSSSILDSESGDRRRPIVGREKGDARALSASPFPFPVALRLARPAGDYSSVPVPLQKHATWPLVHARVS